MWSNWSYKTLHDCRWQDDFIVLTLNNVPGTQTDNYWLQGNLGRDQKKFFFFWKLKNAWIQNNSEEDHAFIIFKVTIGILDC